MSVPSGDFALVLRPEARPIFGATLALLKQLKWPGEPGKPEPLCLVCEDVDFGGSLVAADVVAAEPGAQLLRIWIPHGFVLLAFDFERARSVGFVAD